MPDLDTFDRDGVVAVDGLLTESEAADAVALLEREVDAARQDPERAGRVTGGTVHLADVRDIGLPKVWEDPRVVAVLSHHLGGMPVATAVGYRAPQPGYGAQVLHMDWAGPVPPGDWQVANLIVALVPFTEGNGVTRVVPGSHRDPYQRFQAKSPTDRHPHERPLTGPAGTGFVFSGHILHSGTANRSAAPRHALLINYRRSN